MFQIVLWGSTGLLLAALFVYWGRQSARERSEAELAQRWRNATVWNADTSARVVRVSRREGGIAWLNDGEGDIEVALPESVPPALNTGWYVHVAGWVPARRAARKGRAAKLRAANVRDVFPPGTSALNDRLVGRGDRKPGFVSRLLGLRGL